jgi:hypothetical protein
MAQFTNTPSGIRILLRIRNADPDPGVKEIEYTYPIGTDSDTKTVPFRPLHLIQQRYMYINPLIPVALLLFLRFSPKCGEKQFPVGKI